MIELSFIFSLFHFLAVAVRCIFRVYFPHFHVKRVSVPPQQSRTTTLTFERLFHPSVTSSFLFALLHC